MALASATVLEGSQSTWNFPPFKVLTVNFIIDGVDAKRHQNLYRSIEDTGLCCSSLEEVPFDFVLHKFVENFRQSRAVAVRMNEKELERNLTYSSRTEAVCLCQ